MATVKYELPTYEFDELKALNLLPGTLRKEYSRLRSIARKRLERMSTSAYKSSQTYLRYRNMFPSLPSMDALTKRGSVSKAKLEKKLSELRKFLDLETSTVSGARRVSKSRIAQLQSKGYTFIKTEKDLRKFGEFMDYNRALKKGGLYDSERVIEMMDKVDQRGINVDQVKKDFDWWMQNYELLDDVPEMIGSRSAGLWKQALEAFLGGLT